MKHEQHPLLSLAHSYQVRAVDRAPAGCDYSFRVGAWRVRTTGELFVNTPNATGPKTKKQDIETGEDQKGE